MTRTPFGWCFIGTGRLAETVAGEILPNGHRIVSVYSRTYERAAVFAARHGAEVYADPEAAMTAAGVEGVYVVTPHSSHAEYAETAIRLGVPVFCEKPFTVRAKDAEDLFRLAADKQVYAAEAMWTWFAPPARVVREWIDNRRLGDIQTVNISYCASFMHDASRLTDPMAAGGALLDIGVYPLTYLYRLFGEPVSVSCHGVLENGVDVSDTIEVNYDGFSCHVEVSMCDDSCGEQLHIRGSEADIYIDHYHNAGQVRLVFHNGREEIYTGITDYLTEFDIAADEIRSGLISSVLVPPDATVAVMKIMDECRRQMRLVYPFERQ
ncbi:MAG: Gfo/Idh/MocA family oxidoreductase [Solobacterium sp.]|nr:Gfo/Idh/MocA family oxidoreductase [Solobacterium sp.]